MQFDRLSLTGFKSFVEPAELRIEPGLTGVVGPNGCGKSNLLEALRWVMGESRPTAMRGGGMEDVIFAGTDARPARPYAEVRLTVHDAARTAPAALAAGERIEVARRITRDAGSTYRVDGREVRARDVALLFADAATGARSPSLVRQGQIGELIAAAPRARRRILEDAAGIGGLHVRRHEAELRLRAAEANLSRLDDVRAAIEGRLAALDRQAKVAARYRDIGAALRRAEGALLWRRWRDAADAAEAAGAALDAAARAARAAEAAATAQRERRAGADGALPALREEEVVADAVLRRLEAEAARHAAAEADAAAAGTAARAALEEVERDEAREAALATDARASAGRARAEAAEIESALDGQAEAEARADDALRTAETARDAAGGAERAAAEAAARAVGARDAAERAVGAARGALRRIAAALAEAAAAEPAARAAAEGAGVAAAAAAAVLGEARRAAAAAEEALAVAEGAAALARPREAAARTALSAARGAVAALEAEAEGLERAARRDGAEGGVLADIRVAPGYERALAAALGEELNEPEAKGGAGWRALPPQDVPAMPGEPLAARVEAPAALARTLARVAVVPAEDGAAAQAGLGPGERLVSPAGDLWRWDGLVRPAGAGSAAAAALERRARAEVLRAEVAAAVADVAQAEAAHVEAVRAVREATAAEETARRVRDGARGALARAERDAMRSAGQDEMAAERAAVAGAALERHRVREAEARAEAEAAAEALAALPDGAAVRAAAEDARAALDRARGAAADARARAGALRAEGAARRTRLDAVRAEAEAWQARLADAGVRAGELGARRRAAQGALRAAQAAPGRIAAARGDLPGRVLAAEGRRRAAGAALAAGEAAAREAGEGERAAERAASEARERRAMAQARAEAAGGAVAAAQARAEADGGAARDLPAAAGFDPAEVGTAEALEAETAALRARRDGLGPVNLRAAADAEAARAEAGAMAGQVAELEGAIAKLRGAIGGLNREGRARLLAAFEQVNGTFGALFRHLFGGGEARLELVDSDDPLEAGLEILCQPPGKRLAALTLLSGGEQTLTAMALIFAVFLSNPAPICVLDEVDAPLDDANVARFCGLLDEMTERTRTRFLVITHHAITMGRMDRLYGVTMAEPGVSQLVSVDLSAAEGLVA